MICVVMPNFAKHPPRATILYFRWVATWWACVQMAPDSESANVIRWQPCDSLAMNKSQMTFGIGGKETDSPQQLTNRDKCRSPEKRSTTEQTRSLVAWQLTKDRKCRGWGSFMDFSEMKGECKYSYTL